MSAQLRAGSAKAVITPALATPMGGNARMDNYARGILQDLFARVLYIEGPDAPLCLVSLDLLGLWQSDADPIRNAVGEALTIPAQNVIVASTHTHSGPDTFQTLAWNEDKLQRDRELLKPFWETLPAKVAAAAQSAKQNVRPATLHHGTAANHDIAHNRRLLMKTGATRMNWELPPADHVERALGPVDHQVAVATFRGEDGAMIGGFVHFPCHPAILAGANLQMSADFPGFAMAQLEEELNCDAMLFFMGASGNINHIDYHHPERGRDACEVHRCADSLVRSVHEALATAAEHNANVTIRTAATELLQPFRPIDEPSISAAQELLASYDGRDLSMPDGVPPELNARRTLKLAEATRTGKYPGKFANLRNCQVVLPLQVARIGDILLGCVPAEIFVEFGMAFRERLTANTTVPTLPLLLGLTNGLAGYIPTTEAFAQGGYEPGLGPSYLAENAGNEIIETLIRLAADTGL